MVNSLLAPLLGLHGLVAYVIVVALCFGEAAVLLGFVLPGETAVVLGGVLASEHHVNLVAMVVLVVVAAVVGDSVGYAVGKRFGASVFGLGLHSGGGHATIVGLTCDDERTAG